MAGCAAILAAWFHQSIQGKNMDDPGKESNIETRILTWLSAEGYPLEFATAQAFRKANFHVRQGYYIQHQPGGPPREIDVVASITHSRHDMLIRVEHAIECKWSDNKPWVLFCGDGGMTTAACV